MTAKRRPYISKDIRLAAALAQLYHLRGEGLPFDELKKLTAKEYLARFQLDHVVFYTWAPSVPHFTGLTFMLVPQHKEKTRRDVKEIAKVRRGLKKRAGTAKPKRKWPSRPWAGSKADREMRVAR